VTGNSQEIVDLLADITSRRAVLLNFNLDHIWEDIEERWIDAIPIGPRRIRIRMETINRIVRDGIPEPQTRYDRSGFEIRRRLNLEIASSFLGRLFPFSLGGLGAPSPLPIRQCAKTLPLLVGSTRAIFLILVSHHEKPTACDATADLTPRDSVSQMPIDVVE